MSVVRDVSDPRARIRALGAALSSYRVPQELPQQTGRLVAATRRRQAPSAAA